MPFLEWKLLNWILIQISLKFVHGGQFNNMKALVEIVAKRRTGDKS